MDNAFELEQFFIFEDVLNLMIFPQIKGIQSPFTKGSKTKDSIIEKINFSPDLKDSEKTQTLQQHNKISQRGNIHNLKPKCSFVSNVVHLQMKTQSQAKGQGVFVRKSFRELKKNQNLPKFICKLFMQHFDNYSQNLEERQMVEQIKTFLTSKKKEISEDRNALYTISHMENLFTYQQQRKGQVCREIFNQILKHEIFPLLHDKSKIKNSFMSYLIGMKVFKNRTRNKNLIKRTQFKFK